VLTPRLSSLWIHLVTPLSSRIARPLTEGLRNRVVVRDNRAAELMPQTLLSTREAIELAIRRSREHAVATSWSDAGPIPGDPDWSGGTSFVDRRVVEIQAGPAEVFHAVRRIGGGHGWYAADYLWRIRGALDKLVGGPGLRRGRRDPDTINFGDALDFWRVTGVVQDQLLQLRAEMKLPGEALLAFEIEPIANGVSRLTQTASFLPRGLFGLLYWWAVYPFHGFVFRGMLQGIQRAAESIVEADSPSTETSARRESFT
ncbi:MAG: SDR family oxidoreductase, partial [Acidobacteriota bacterium]